MKKTVLIFYFLSSLLFANEKLDNQIEKSLEDKFTIKSNGFNMQFVKYVKKYKILNHNQTIYKLEVVKNNWHHGMKEYEEIKTLYYILVDIVSFQNDKLYYNAYNLEDVNKALKKNTIDLSDLKQIN